MPDSPMFNVGRPRRSFLDDTYADDDRLAAWAEETGRNAPVTREGSTAFEFTDPKTGERRYVMRRNSQAGRIDLGKNGKVMQRENGSGQLEDFITQDKTYRKPLTNRMAESMRGDFEKDMERKRVETERERARTERMAEEDRAQKRAIEMEREKMALEGERDVNRRARIPTDPEKMTPDERKAFAEAKLMEASIGRAGKRQEAEYTREESIDTMVAKASAGEDVPNISTSGEAAIRSAANMGLPPSAAMARGMEAHERDVAKIRQLEESGDPELIAQAQSLRNADPDLGRLQSFLDTVKQKRFMDERSLNEEREFGGAERELQDKLVESGGYGSDVAQAAIPVVGPFMAAVSMLKRWDGVSPEDQTKMRDTFNDTVLRLRASMPYKSEAEIKQILAQRLRVRNIPGRIINAVLG